MKGREIRITFIAMAGAFLALQFSSVAHAFTSPSAGSFAYDVYDIVVNQILNGPIGTVAGLAAIVLGAIAAIRSQIMLAVPSIIGGAVLIKADAIAQSMGALF